MSVLFTKLATALEQKQPFVVYRKPTEKQCYALFQKNQKVYTTTKLIESGFIFAPFNTENDIILLPSNQCEVVLETLKFPEQSLKPVIFSFSSETKNQHLTLVSKAVKKIHEGNLQKVVLSRRQQIEKKEIDIAAILKRMLATYKNAFVYCWYHPTIGIWLGASPETLIKTNQNSFSTMALAGTQVFSKNAAKKWTVKEHHEHQLVVDYIAKQLDFISDLKITATKTVKAANVCHLQTNISGSFDISVFHKIVNSLHPTPAVCGFPKEKATQFILENEAYNRSFYTGFFGEMNMNNQSYLAVNLRCMQLKNKKALLYIGGGITNESIPENEWQETLEKAKVMQAVL